MGKFNTIQEALEDIKAGKIVLVTDDEDRENEGDFICAAQYASPENLNFMATHGKGLICMPISEEIAKRLQLDQMVTNNTDNHETAFTVSIDHVDTTTGISAFERSMTAMKLADEDSKPEDFRRPGHMFPLLAKKGGVLIRNGHTEATVDLMKFAGLKECGICCEIMGEDGNMLRQKDLFPLAEKFGMKIISITDLQNYKRKKEILVSREADVAMPTKYGDFRAVGYVNKLNGEHHVALVKGDIGDGKNVLVRVHSECLTGDCFGSLRCDCGQQFAEAMKMVEKEGRGIVLYMRQEGRGIGLINKLKAYELQEKGYDTVEANLKLGYPDDLREYSIGAQILADLGVKEICLITNNPAKVYGLKGFGMEIVKRIPVEIKPNDIDRFYLKTKKEKMKHILEQV